MRAALLLLIAAPVAAEPTWNVGLRASAAFGELKQFTWEYPEVDVVGTYVHGRTYASVFAGFTRIDNHTFLSEGRAERFGIAGGATVLPNLRAGAMVSLDAIAFDPDVDVVTEHPDVDLHKSGGRVLPMTGIELAYAVTAATTLGAFARVALVDLTLFDTPSGDRGTARLVLGGAFLEVRIR
jgi:hypothetical protein